MPVAFCSKCNRPISISQLPGGNPATKMFPGMFATSYGFCDECHQTYCDECISKNFGKCPGCGRKIEIKEP
jgi:hypothetical protein